MTRPHGDWRMGTALRVLTIGVYGFDEPGFFAALTNAGVDTLCDIRRRRGLRGSTYAFANSQRLQGRLAELGIKYVHMQHLAPSDAVRTVQSFKDASHGVGKRSRNELSPEFVYAYRAECLQRFDVPRFVEDLGPTSHVVALFCVEQKPAACHRSIVAAEIGRELGIAVEHLEP